MHLARSLRTLRSIALGAVLAVGALVATTRDAAAQLPALTIGYEAPCGPGTPCSLVQLNITNTTGALLQLNTLTLFASNASFAFTPVGPTTVGYADDAGLWSAPAESGGSQIFVDFLGGGFTFELAAGNTGFLELQLAATPVLQSGAFTYYAELPMDGRIEGSVSVTSTATVPEPSTYLLLATGLGTLGMIARRRRTAA